jgi:23S rRNA (cytosine1962-C5)-methyltransferase
MDSIILKKDGGRRIKSGYQWIFSNEIEKIDGNPANGDIINVMNFQNIFIGKGFFNKNSLISVRILTTKDEEINNEFYKNRIIQALNLRKEIFPHSNTYRLVFSESDLLPGLIIDRFEDDFAIQTYSIGMEKNIDVILDVIKELFNPSSIIEKNESVLRTLEGLDLRTSLLYGNYISKNILIDDLIYSIDLLRGQKSGFFLDQRINRTLIRKYCINKKVLDCFCNEGGFALNAAYSKANDILGVDISDHAIEKASVNADLNSIKNCRFETGDVFRKLEEIKSSNEKYDVIILDPPSFTKSKKNIPTARKGYKKINSLAMNSIVNGGFLITSSCSHHIFENEFLDIMREASANYDIQLMELHSAAPDHPILISMPETKYLKFAIFRIIK